VRLPILAGVALLRQSRRRRAPNFHIALSHLTALTRADGQRQLRNHHTRFSNTTIRYDELEFAF
jgi:hypothetical protein